MDALRRIEKCATMKKNGQEELFMTIKEKVEAGMKLCGTHVNLVDPTVTEIFGHLGYDYIWVDMEHTALAPYEVYQHILAAKSTGTPVFVRVPVDDLTFGKKILEMAVDGVIFPMVRDAEHARQLLDMTLYPPYGTRGCGPKGAIRYGIDDEPAFYREDHLRKLCRFVQIEQKSAAEDAEAIAALPYIDGCVLGLYDLSGSIGRPGDIFCEENLALAEHAIRAFRAQGKTVGISTFSTDLETLARYDAMGINMITTGADYVYVLEKGRETLQKMKNLFGR